MVYRICNKKQLQLIFLTCIELLTFLGVKAQSTGNAGSKNVAKSQNDTVKQTDLMEVGKKLFRTHREAKSIPQEDSGLVIHPLVHPLLQTDSAKIKPGKFFFAPFPVVGYTLQTGVIAIVAANLSFYTGKSDSTNLSSIAINPAFSLTYPQILLPVIFDIWSSKNKINFKGDWRYYKYPTYTYGLGGHTSLSNADLVDYSYVRIYQEILKRISSSSFYTGIGYNLDYHFNIKEVDQGKDFELYNINAQKTVSSGLSLNLLYDTRKNENYPEHATYFNLSYRYNSTLMGSNQNWQSLYLDLRKFINLSTNSHNVLAFWSLNWFTFGGKPPYFDLPSTGWDSYSNTGRGYIQSRLRGPSMLYLESEYRFGITRNGLFGGVLFINAESVSELQSKRFETVLPGYGLGIRIKLNKLSGVHLAIDYGFGSEGSQGLFFNVSEVF